MPNIVLSANTSWYLYNFRRSTLKALLAEGFTVICIAPKDAYSERLESELGCRWLDLQMDSKGSNPIKDIKVFWQLYRYYKANKPVAALHFTIKNNIYGTWAAKLLKISAINNVSGLGTAFLHGGPTSMIARLLYRSCFFFSSFVFCQNEEDWALLLKLPAVNAKALKCLPGSGVDVKRFSPELRQNDAAVFRFLFVGRMLADKGLHELMAAAAILVEAGLKFELVLVGFADVDNHSAISKNQIEAWCEEREYLKYKGSTDHIEQEMAVVDCVVLPSYREGMPRTLLEAGAMALPVITTDVPGCRNIVTHKVNGLLCKARSADSLAEAMKAMMTMPDNAREALGTNGMVRVRESFSESIVVDETLAVVKKMIANHT